MAGVPNPRIYAKFGPGLKLTSVAKFGPIQNGLKLIYKYFAALLQEIINYVVT